MQKEELAKLKVLIVDDDLDICKLLQDFCALMDIKADYLTDPTKIDEVESKSYDIIFLDQNFPNIKGLDVLQRGYFKDSSVYIVVMTGAVLEQEMVNTMLKLGVNEFLKKPFDFNTIQKILFRALTFHREVLTFYKACQLLEKSEMEFKINNDLSILGTVARMIVRNVKELGFVESLKMIETAIIEALSNAIIHGNLQISSSVKDIGFEKFEEELSSKLKDSNFSSRKVYVYSYLDKTKFVVRIRDEGEGFNWRDLETGDIYSLYGRGIFIIKSVFDEVRWNEKGNEIEMIKYPLSSSVKQNP